MMMTLAWFGGAIGLIVTGSAVLLAWTVYSRAQAEAAPSAVPEEAAAQDTANPEDSGNAAVRTKERPEDQPSLSAVLVRQAGPHLARWTFFDYALLALFLIGSLFLFTDLLAVLRDAEQYPPYHFPYLLCGFVFTLAGMLMMLVRLALTIALVRSERPLPAPDHQDHPGDAEQAQ
ncbi:hypothetical protein SAMN04487970_100323 [Paenibacillus tianmuensis]|uniref:Uncharacterized protein n=1 Tax=Paenibacillus tianmuensis TaxID=624147 RepID=A0A1G4PKG7_9BACL|nr:hypothetical protein [Paenibacillus tianmuensis]SCW32844.1 hypothetical protein SAMN04487970_100323 [Paenibacillus tianmuensis]